MKSRVIILIVLFVLLFGTPKQSSAQATPGLLLPIGAGYTDTYTVMGKYAVDNVRGDVVHILLLATTYSTNAESISQGERTQNLKDAEERRIQTEGACQRNLPEGSSLTCKVELLPIFTQEDANNPANLAYFTDDVSMIFILGGDQETGMLAIINTPVEKRIEELHDMGTIISGTSAGAAMQSKVMLASLNIGYSAQTGLFFGATDIWNTADKRGFNFGIQNAVVDQHFYQRARMGRLINVIVQPGLPHIGVGVDAYTGVVSDNELLRDLFGLYTVTVLDADTYHAADAVKYVDIGGSHPPILSVRNIIVNLLSPGDVSYDLKTHKSSLGNPPAVLKRSFETLSIPAGAGPLFLGGDLTDTLDNSPILKQFKAVAGGHVLIIASGYPSSHSAETGIKKYSAGLGIAVESIVAGDEPVTIPEDVTGILVISKDQSKINPAALTPLKDFWLSGKPVMADNAAMPVFGAFYAKHEPTPDDAELQELATQKSFWQGRTKMEPGLGWVNIDLEPQLLADLRFGRLFSLAYNHPGLLALGVNKDTAILFDQNGAQVLGENGVFVFDLRKSQTELGTNDGFVIGNAMLDVFAPGESIQAETADVNARFDPAPTPVLPTPVPTATATLAAPTLQPATATVLAPTEPAVAEPVPAAQSAFSTWVIFLAAGVVVVAALFFFGKRK